MPVSHSRPLPQDNQTALMRLRAFLEERRRGGKPLPDFCDFGRQLQVLLNEVGSEVTGEELARHDVDVPVVVIEGAVHLPYLTASFSALTGRGFTTW